MYRLLLRLLPRPRRDQFGAEMAAVFAEQRRGAGPVRAGLLWMKESAGMVRFSAREWLARARARLGWPYHRRPGGRFANELRWAWRSVRARGWRAAMIVGLLAVALAANTLVFSAADSLVFRRLPFQGAARLVTFWSAGPASKFKQPWSATAAQFDLLRERTDLFAGVHGYRWGSYTFIMDASSASQEATTFITPGLVEMLGWHPAWGRTLTEVDALDRHTRATLVSESLARERFGDPALAVGRRLETSDDPLMIVGVMPGGFQFPDGRDRVWRPLDYRSMTALPISPIARLARGVSADAVVVGLTGLSRSAAEAHSLKPGDHLEAGALANAEARASERQLLIILMGAALCLLVIACANVASLELAGALARARTYAVHMALGATRATLVRSAVMEGAWLVGGAMAIAALLAWWGLGLLIDWLPDTLRTLSANPVDLDVRALCFMGAIAVATWLAASLPVAVVSSRRDVLDVLKIEGRTAAASRGGTHVRRLLTVIEMALAVLLLVGAALYVRSYVALLRLDKGFDSERVAEIDLTLPSATYSAPGSTTALSDQVKARLAARPDVKAFTFIYSNPFDMQSSTTGRLELEDGRVIEEAVYLFPRTVDSGFFDTVRLPLEHGRLFTAGEPTENVIVTDVLAGRLWPGENPIDRRFRTKPDAPWLTVVGVVKHIRYASETPFARVTRTYEIYSAVQPPLPRPVTTAPAVGAATSPAPAPNAPRSGPIYRFLTFAVRLDDRARIADVMGAVRGIDSRFRIRVEWINEAYANEFRDHLLAARIVGGFGVLSFLVATAGIYAVMAFLVAGRTREIGVRMALGAGRRDIARLVLGSGLRLVVTGAAIGLAAAVVASHWIRSQLFGVSPVDPITYALVTVVVVGTALMATWYPARTASRVDPSVTLRAE
jgi:predicted permease